MSNDLNKEGLDMAAEAFLINPKFPECLDDAIRAYKECEESQATENYLIFKSKYEQDKFYNSGYIKGYGDALEEVNNETNNRPADFN